MQTSTYRSSDGGRTFVAWKGTPSGEDDHVLWIAPENTNRIIEGTDQGAVITYDCGKTWNSWFNQPTGQFYRVSTDNSFPYHLYAAQQDSGSSSFPIAPTTALSPIAIGFPVAPLRAVSSRLTRCILITFTLSAGTETSFVLTAPPVKPRRSSSHHPNYRASWETPITFSPRDPHALFYGSQFLLKTVDAGITWHEISPDLTVQAWRIFSRTKVRCSRSHPFKRRHGKFWFFCRHGR